MPKTTNNSLDRKSSNKKHKKTQGDPNKKTTSQKKTSLQSKATVSDMTKTKENDSEEMKKDIQVIEKNFKTEVCKAWLDGKHCRWGDNCLFAHGISELRERTDRHKKFKTILCSSYHSTGYCPYGSRCSFIHSELYIPKDVKPRLHCFKKITCGKEIPLRSRSTNTAILDQFKHVELF